MFVASVPDMRFLQGPRPLGRSSCYSKGPPPRKIVTAYAAPLKTPEIVQTPREVLGVGLEADAQEIKTAFRRLALKHHPDLQGGDESHFVEILRAYEILVGKSDGKDGTEHADWDFHDWYWKFTMSRSRGAAQKRSGSFQTDLSSQLAGLRQRAAVRAAKARAEQHTCVQGSTEVDYDDDDFVDYSDSPSDSGACSDEDSFNPYERMAEEARRRARIGSSEVKESVTSQLTGLRRRARIRQEL